MMNDPNAGLRIDLGCGSVKKEGTIGVDLLASPGVDHVLDMEKEPLPFANESVVYVHSSHFLEHIRDPTHIFAEIGRVCADKAQVELWTPYAWSNPAFIIDHKLFYTEDIYIHMCMWFIDFWKKILGARWILEEFQYVIEPRTLCYLKEQGISLDFAIRHLHNVVPEFGTYMTVSRNSSDVPSPPVRRTFSTSRLAPRYEIKPDPRATPLGATGSESVDNDLLEKAIREFSTGSSLPVL